MHKLFTLAILLFVAISLIFTPIDLGSDDQPSESVTGELIHEEKDEGITRLRFHKVSCNNKGKLSFILKNAGSKKISTDNITVKARSKKNTSYEHVVKGEWRKPYVRPWGPSLPQNDKTESTFRSDSGFLNLSGDYTVSLEYENCGEHRECVEEYQLYNCPGNTYKCSKCDLEVLSCENKGNTTEIRFIGAKKGQFGEGNIKEDYLFSFYGEKKTVTMNHLPDNVEHEYVKGNDTFILTLSESHYGNLSKVDVTHEYCNARSFLLCRTEEELEQDKKGNKTVAKEGICIPPTEEQPARIEQPMGWQMSSQVSPSKRVTVIVIEERNASQAFTNDLMGLLSNLISSTQTG